MSEPEYTSSSGVTVQDVTNGWVSEGFVACVLKISSGISHEYVVSTRSRGGYDELRPDCYLDLDGQLCDSHGSVIATPRPKLKKYRPFRDGTEFLQVTEGRTVWVRYDREMPIHQVVKVDDNEIETVGWKWIFADHDSSLQMTLTPHIADSWVPFGVEES